MKIKLIAFFATLLLFSCNSKNGYSDLDELYSDFVVYLKDPDTENLKNYCHQITPDQSTFDYMKKHKISYRGIPEELEKYKIKPSYIGDKYYESVLYFKMNLKRKNQLDNLEYIGREEEGEEIIDKKLNIYITETLILLKSGKDTIKYKLGEMLKIDNKWLSFTQPKLGL